MSGNGSKSKTGARSKKAQTVIEPPEQETDKAKLIEMAIHKMEKKLSSDEVKASIGDFIRLLQLQKDFYGDQPRQVTVTWVESIEKESVPEK